MVYNSLYLNFFIFSLCEQLLYSNKYILMPFARSQGHINLFKIIKNTNYIKEYLLFLLFLKIILNNESYSN